MVYYWTSSERDMAEVRISICELLPECESVAYNSMLFTAKVASLLTSQAMLGQLYADDVQAYQHCPASDALVTAGAMSRTMEALGSWMSSNRLRLNPHKTQFIWLGTRQQLAKLD